MAESHVNAELSKHVSMLQNILKTEFNKEFITNDDDQPLIVQTKIK